MTANLNKVCPMQMLIKTKQNWRAALLLLVMVWPFTATAGLTSEDLLVLKVESEGVYRLTYEDILNETGLDLQGLSHARFAVRVNGKEIAVNSKGRLEGNKRTSKFGAGAYLEFYVDPQLSLYSEQTALVVSYGNRNVRMSKETNNVKHLDAGATVYNRELVYQESNYYDFQSPAVNDPWHYGQVYSFHPTDDASGTEVAFSLPGLVGTTADIEAEFIGVTDIDVDGNDHHVVALINGVEVKDEQFDGNVLHTVSVDDAQVSENNTFGFAIRAIATTPYDVMALNKLTVRYPSQTQAIDDRVDGYFAPRQVVKVSGFSSDDIMVYAIDNSGTAKIVSKSLAAGAGALKFKTGTDGARYIAVGKTGYKSVNAIELPPVLTDISSGQAEYLIITHSDFVGPDLEIFAAMRAGTYSVKVVDVEQVYMQYGDEIVPSADAISNYIKFAHQNLGTEFVLFVGGDTYDYKNYVSASKSFIPTQYVTTYGDGLTIRQAPSDAKYGDIDDDGVPDIAVGRFPVRTQAELSNIIEKINDYQARIGYSGRIVMVADQADSGNGVSFTRDAITLVDTIPGDWAGSIREDYRALPDLDGAVTAKSKLFAAVDAGVSVTAYIGHSSQARWSRTSPALLMAGEIASFNNIDKPTVVTQWGCWNTYFVHPSGNSMAELFLNPGLNGAATVLGASTLTSAADEYLLASELNKVMYAEGEPIGRAVIKAKKALALINPKASDVLLGWQILGDPALVINH